MNRQTIFVLIGAAIIIAAILIFMRRPRVGGASVFETYFLNGNTQETNTNTSKPGYGAGSFLIPVGWMNNFDETYEGQPVEQHVITYTNQ